MMSDRPIPKHARPRDSTLRADLVRGCAGKARTVILGGLIRRSAVLRSALLLAALVALVPAWAEAGPKPKPEEPDKPAADVKAGSEQPKEADKEEEEKKEEEKDRFLAITGGYVHTVTQGDCFGATILSKNGKIQEIGPTIQIPEDAEVLDATGYHVYPGLIAASSSGVLGSDPADDTTDVYSFRMTLALAGGITTMAVGNMAAKPTFGTTDDMVVKRKLLETIRYSSHNPGGRQKLRVAFEKVRQYLRDLEAYVEKKKTDPKAEEPEKDWIKGDYETYLKLMRHEAVALVEAGTAHEILDVCDLAERYDFEVVVRSAVEGWTVAPAMARAGLSAIITPRADVGQNEWLNRPNGSSIENAAILHAHGVPIAIVPQITAITTRGVAGRDLLHLNLEAGFAVRGGLPEAAAVRAICIDAARILGIDHRVGSIEVGKDADFVVTDGDLLHYMTHARWTIVNGRIVYDKQKEALYSHIRPDGDLDAPPPEDYWPRRLGADR